MAKKQEESVKVVSPTLVTPEMRYLISRTAGGIDPKYYPLLSVCQDVGFVCEDWAGVWKPEFDYWLQVGYGAEGIRGTIDYVKVLGAFNLYQPRCLTGILGTYYRLHPKV